MAWLEGVDVTRVLIAPDASASGNGTARILHLRHPKSGNATCFLLTNGALQELHWFKQSYMSWFLGDYVSEDGCLYIATPVDPVFVMLPIFEEARMKAKDDPGKFRQLDEIMFVNGYPGNQHLLAVAEEAMQLVCEIREIGSSKFFRLDDSKVIAWLYYKVCQLKRTLPILDKNYAAQDEKNTCMVCNQCSFNNRGVLEGAVVGALVLNLQDLSNKAPDIQVTVGTSLGASNLLQENTGNDRKTTRSVKQAKKAKVETNSQSIREMFRRSSGRRG